MTLARQASYMRLVFAAAAAALVAVPTVAAAQSTDASASAAFGVGAFGERPAMSLDLGVDLERGDLAVGVGGRVRWLVGEGVRDEDWDDLSEYGSVIRYLSYRRAPTSELPGVAVAAGALGDVRLGHGSVVAGYSSGLDADVRRLGVQAQVRGESLAIGFAIDDVVAPRILAGRGTWQRDARTALGITVAGDLDAPDADGHRVVPVAAVDVSHAWRHATGYIDGVAVADRGVGLHAGAAADATVRGAALIGVVEARVGTRGYVPGYFGPLYEIERRTRLTAELGGGAVGVGGLVGASVAVPGVGQLAASYATRPGRSDVFAVRATAPHYRTLQLGAWGAAQVRGGSERALAAELRAQLPQGFFAVAEAARLYREHDGGFEPVWTATIAVGSALDL